MYTVSFILSGELSEGEFSFLKKEAMMLSNGGGNNPEEKEQMSLRREERIAGATS